MNFDMGMASGILFILGVSLVFGIGIIVAAVREAVKKRRERQP